MAGTNKHLYVLLAEDSRVKIGVSQDVKQRIKQIESAGNSIIQYYSTDFCSNPYEVERDCHDYFKKESLGHEWFNVDFDDAVVVVDEIFSQQAITDEVSKSSWIKIKQLKPKDVLIMQEDAVFFEDIEYDNLNFLDMYYAVVCYSQDVLDVIPVLLLSTAEKIYEVLIIDGRFILNGITAINNYKKTKRYGIGSPLGRFINKSVWEEVDNNFPPVRYKLYKDSGYYGLNPMHIRRLKKKEESSVCEDKE